MAGSFSAFFAALRQRESSGNYSVVNTLGYLGAYQFGEAALVDLGFVNRDSNPYDNRFDAGWTGKLGIDTRREFLNTPDAQDAAAREWVELVWGYLRAVGADDYLGDRVAGITITASGLIAGAHLAGAGNVIDWLETNGADDVSDAYGTSLTSYISLFGGYSIPFASETLNDSWAELLPSVPAGFLARIEAADDAGARRLLGRDAGDDLLRGTHKADVVLAGGGDDVIRGNRGADVISAGGGADVVKAGRGNDIVNGGAGDDRLVGGRGNDILIGARGNDVLVGGPGRDTLTGGSDADRFVFLRGSHADRITDFSPDDGDVIDVSGMPDIRGWRDLVRNHVTDTDDGLRISWTGGRVVLEGVHLDDLDPDDFLFAGWGL